jgi:hypothetical protein
VASVPRSQGAKAGSNQERRKAQYRRRGSYQNWTEASFATGVDRVAHTEPLLSEILDKGDQYRSATAGLFEPIRRRLELTYLPYDALLVRVVCNELFLA